MNDREKRYEGWKAAIDDEQFQVTLRTTLSRRDLAHALANQDILVSMHAVASAAYEKGKADGIEEQRHIPGVGDMRAYFQSLPEVGETPIPRSRNDATRKRTVARGQAELEDVFRNAECAQVTLDLMNLVVAYEMGIEQVQAWTIAELAQAENWAAACLSGRDDVEVPERPLHTLPSTGLYCVECGLLQYISPNGRVCNNGHGGVEGLTLEAITQKRGESFDKA